MNLLDVAPSFRHISRIISILIFFFILFTPMHVMADEGVVSSDELNITSNGVISAIEQSGTILYIGGTFDSLLDQPRRNLGSYDVATKQLTSFAPDINKGVNVIRFLENRMYIGGDFTEINGKPRAHIAVFDLQTLELLDWSTDIESSVRTIDIENNNLMVVGYITKSDGTIQENRYEVAPSTGQIEGGGYNSTSPDPQEIDNTIQEGIVAGLMVDKNKLGFKIPSLSDILTFAVRILFAIAGLAALFYLLLGAFAWVTSGGDKDSIQAARDKIQAAIVGLLMMVLVLSLVWTLEQIIFSRRVCLGLTCPLTLPSLLEAAP